ncbi:hypothetical protein [Streptomyces pseudovenezuelae]|uniref:hypothetical protein n=1 Tax=Streptomyces pseudovenezuelae TaxID=67350 RepID=UPI002E81405A|nr:hypothetical protein [Streptomyces pseudovenezuelae]WUA94467.1 hypothetical protein OHO81_44640 [Streptomyces pseudovenezuelae]
MPTSHTSTCRMADVVRRTESPLIADLVAALRHLEHAAENPTTPDREAAHYQGNATTEQLATWVTGNADRIRAALDTITAPYRGQPELWPAGVTARFLTRIGMRGRDLADATVDIHDDQPAEDARSTARCRPCGWTKGNGLRFRTEVLAWAQEHADQCTALPNPTT